MLFAEGSVPPVGIIVIKNKPELMSGFEKMADIFSRGGNIYAGLGAALDIVSAFYDVVYPRGEKSAERAGRILSGRVREYIEQHYSDSIRIADIADVTGFCCANDMSRKIQEFCGLSPTELRYNTPPQTP